MPDRETHITDIITEFGEIFAFARTRWARFAEEVEPELRGVSLMMLHLIARKGPVSATSIGQLLDMDKAMVSRHLSRLRDLGFVRAEESPEDRRVQLLTISDQGQQLLDRLHEQSAASYRDRFDGWSDDDLARLRHGLHRFNSPGGGAARPNPHAN